MLLEKQRVIDKVVDGRAQEDLFGDGLAEALREAAVEDAVEEP